MIRNHQSSRFIRQQSPNSLALTVTQAGSQNIRPNVLNSGGNTLTIPTSYTIIQDPLIQTLTTSDACLTPTYHALTAATSRYVANSTNNVQINPNNTITLMPVTSSFNNGASSGYYVGTTNQTLNTSNVGPTLQYDNE